MKNFGNISYRPNGFIFSWGFYDLIMADVIDEDRVKWERKESVSTSVHGVQALIVKPSQSLALCLACGC